MTNNKFHTYTVPTENCNGKIVAINTSSGNLVPIKFVTVYQN